MVFQSTDQLVVAAIASPTLQCLPRDEFVSLHMPNGNKNIKNSTKHNVYNLKCSQLLVNEITKIEN